MLLLGVYPGEMKHMSTVFVIAKKGKQLECPPTGERLHTRRGMYNSAVKRNEALIPAKMWLNLGKC